MVALKAQGVDGWLAKPDPTQRTVLLHGPDAGLVSERAAALAKLVAGADDPLAVVQLTADEAAADPHRVAEEAHAVSMFGGTRVVRIAGTTQRNLARAVEPLLLTPPADAWIVIEAGDLKPTHALRKQIEKSPAAVALPCYADPGATLDRLIAEETRRFGLSIEQDAHAFLRDHLGADRLASRNEVQKLCLHAAQDGTITLAHVEAVVSDVSPTELDALTDSVWLGDLDGMEAGVEGLATAGTTEQSIVLAMQRHGLMLHGARIAMDTNRSAARQVVGTLRPPVHFRRRDLVVRSLEIWTGDRLRAALGRIGRTLLDMRRQAVVERELLTTLLLALTMEARAAARRR